MIVMQKKPSLRHRRQQNIQQLSPIVFPESLPVVQKLDTLKQEIEQHQIVLVCGETGSGKTTQLPKICLELGRGIEGCIGHTQPRRVAARSVAARIASELKTELGSVVGYKVRFNDNLRQDSNIKLMTDGILLAEIHSDPLLKQYDTLIIDEAHERSLNIDFLLGYLKQLLPQRPDLKVIITSATLDAERFAHHFNARLIEVSGRSYPVEIRYRPLEADDEGEAVDMPLAICHAVDELSEDRLRGDVLVFLPGEREIRETAESLRKYHFSAMKHHDLEILPLFSRLSAKDQDKVFKTSGKPRIVLATNVAETSLTVPNIGYVIDTGLARVNRYSIRQKVEQLHIEKISQAAANQRAGRSGRVMNGICVRLYDEEAFNQRAEFTDPEIFRVSLATVILRMAALELGDIQAFPFLQPPTPRMINDGYSLLTELGAVNEQRQLTEMGRALARLPLDPKISRLLLAGKQYHCLTEILVIASALTVQDPRERPLDKQQAADECHQRFKEARSDFLSYLLLWQWYQKARKQQKSRRKLTQHCRAHFLSPARLREWFELHQQLHTQVTEMGMRCNQQPGSYEQIHKALLCGLLSNVGMKQVDGYDYQGARGIKFVISPGSALHKKGKKWVLAANLTETHRLFARCVAQIQPQWLEETGAHLIKRHYFDPHWSKKSGQVCAYERSTLYGLIINPKKRVHYGPMNVTESREIFIRQALVAGELFTRATFFKHNQKLIRDIEALEHKSRRPDVLVDDELIFAFYDQRIPADIHNAAAFERWRKRAEQKQPDLLKLNKDDLMRHEAAGITSEQFPAQLTQQELNFAVSYQFAPGKAADGVTLTVPESLINQVSPARCEWLVPGLLPEKVTLLLKSLPQRLRRHLVPVPAFAQQFCDTCQADNLPLLPTLCQFIHNQKQITVQPGDFRHEQLPPHLLMNFKVVNEHGRQLEMSRNLDHLQSRFMPAASSAPIATGNQQPREQYTDWSFGPFESETRVSRAGQPVTVYNALQDDHDHVSIVSFDNQRQAEQCHRRGLRRLFMLQHKSRLQYLKKNLPELQKTSLLFMPYGHQEDLLEQVMQLTFDRCCLQPPLPDDKSSFQKRSQAAKSRLLLVAQELMRLILQILQQEQEIQKNLNSLRAFPTARQDIEQQLQGLIHPHFITQAGFDQLQHYPRYLQAIELRMDKLRNNPGRDQQNQQQIAAIQQPWEKLTQDHRCQHDPQVIELGWLLQELRVSLFAQQLKTPVIVSVKRLKKFLDKIHQEIKA